MIAPVQLFITGATGFIGRALAHRAAEQGHGTIAWVRDPERAKAGLPGADLIPLDRDPTEALTRADAVINLAGEPVVGRWSDAKKAALISSRVGVTERLVGAIGRASPRPKVLVSGSAVGYYGDRGAEIVDESAPSGDDFLAHLCRDWEAAARRAEEHGVRVALIRTGVVLGHGGALSKMLPAFKAGAGGKIGSGEQYMPWIHLDDLVTLLLTAATDERYRGPINGVGPTPVTNVEFTKTLGHVLHRPTIVPVPAFALKVVFGEGAFVLTSGQRAMPVKAEGLGFRFEYPALEAALTQAVG